MANTQKLLAPKIVIVVSLALCSAVSYADNSIKMCNKFASDLMNDAVIRGLCSKRFPDMKKPMTEFFKSTLLGKLEPYCSIETYSKEKYEKDLALFEHFFEMPEKKAKKICNDYYVMPRRNEAKHKKEILEFIKSQNE